MNNMIARCESTLSQTDNMPGDLRACVHEFGFPIVDACLQAKVSDPRRIRQLVLEIWAGARQIGQRGGAEGTLDWVLMQAGANISAATLERVLADFNFHIVPTNPNRAMLDASMAEVCGFNERMTKTEKHRRRLVAAIRACGFRFRLLTKEAA
jgi:hypothetical protein